MEAVRFSETLVPASSTRSHNPGDENL